MRALINNYIDFRTYGGVIYEDDFETDYYPKHGRNIAQRISWDLEFDERCRKKKNIEKHDNNKYSGMSIEDFVEELFGKEF